MTEPGQDFTFCLPWWFTFSLPFLYRNSALPVVDLFVEFIPGDFGDGAG
jgi:hypothetical protein